MTTTRRHPLAVLLAAVLACATPAAALAQNAGDEQYADPFGKVENQKKSSGGGQQGSTGQGASTPAQQPTQAAQASGSPTTATSSSQTLPRTGLPAGLLAAGGLALLGSGAALRRASELPR